MDTLEAVTNKFPPGQRARIVSERSDRQLETVTVERVSLVNGRPLVWLVGGGLFGPEELQPI